MLVRVNHGPELSFVLIIGIGMCYLLVRSACFAILFLISGLQEAFLFRAAALQQRLEVPLPHLLCNFLEPGLLVNTAATHHCLYPVPLCALNY